MYSGPATPAVLGLPSYSGVEIPKEQTVTCSRTHIKCQSLFHKELDILYNKISGKLEIIILVSPMKEYPAE